MKLFDKVESPDSNAEDDSSFLEKHREWIGERLKEHIDAIRTSSLIAAGAALFIQNPGAKQALAAGALSAIAVGIDKAPWRAA